jgi:hypothetical protein
MFNPNNFKISGLKPESILNLQNNNVRSAPLAGNNSGKVEGCNAN